MPRPDSTPSTATVAVTQDVDHHEVVGAALVRDGTVLLCHRHPGRRWYPDVWDLPGGHVEPGEDPAAALARELDEELGVRADVDGAPLWRLDEDGMGLQVWRVVRWQGEPCVRDTAEHDGLLWVRPGDAGRLRLAHPAYVGLLGLLEHRDASGPPVR